MARRREVEELDFDNIHLTPDPDRYDIFEKSNYADRGYRWQDDPARYEPEKPKKPRRRK